MLYLPIERAASRNDFSTSSLSGSVRLVRSGRLVRLVAAICRVYCTAPPKCRGVTPNIAAISFLVIPSLSNAGMRANMSSVIRDLFIAAQTDGVEAVFIQSDVLVKFAARRLLRFSPAAVTSPYPRHVSRRRSVLLVIAGQTFAISRQCDLWDGLIPKTIVAYQVDDPLDCIGRFSA